MRFRLTPKSITLNDLERSDLDLEISSNFRRISRDFADFGEATTSKRMKIETEL